ncbi:MAG: hypothetical protein LBS62_04870 [Clostridiales bacterium]|jgi:predicted transposase/invertase (TIGR01784 family)|nr:hypothetical protein [Clostridiales bacterium]
MAEGSDWDEAEEERIRQYHRLKYEIDRESQLIYAEKMGFKRGMEAGMAKGIIKTAKNALAMGLSLEQIEQFTGLSREEIEGCGIFQVGGDTKESGNG